MTLPSPEGGGREEGGKTRKKGRIKTDSGGKGNRAQLRLGGAHQTTTETNYFKNTHTDTQTYIHAYIDTHSQDTATPGDTHKPMAENNYFKNTNPDTQTYIHTYRRIDRYMFRA